MDQCEMQTKKKMDNARIKEKYLTILVFLTECYLWKSERKIDVNIGNRQISSQSSSAYDRIDFSLQHNTGLHIHIPHLFNILPNFPWFSFFLFMLFHFLIGNVLRQNVYKR